MLPGQNGSPHGPNEERFRAPYSDEVRLDALFQEYRAACEPREESVNFMPELWRKIEKTQSATFSFRRIAKGFMTVAAALSLLLAVIGFLPIHSQNAPLYHTSYIDALAAHYEAVDARKVSESVEYVQDVLHPDSYDEPAAEI
jgi:hypothetical protein